MYLNKIAIVLLVLLIPFSMAKAPDRSAANSYNAGGHVYNDQGFALEGVVVKSGSIENITNKDGYYLMAGLSDGTYNFSYSKTGYDTGYLNVRIKGADVVNADKTLYKISPAPQPTQTRFQHLLRNQHLLRSQNPHQSEYTYHLFRLASQVHRATSG